MSLTRRQIEDFQDGAATGTLYVEGVEPAQLVFLAQMALEGDAGAWAAVTRIAGSGGYGQEQRPPDQALPVSGCMIGYEFPEQRTIPCQSWRRKGRIRPRQPP